MWYLIKGTRKVQNKVRKFLPSYEGPFFVLGQLDDLVYRIQKGPKSKMKVVHHDQLKRYHSRDLLDNSWVFDRARSWTPVEVPYPTLDIYPSNQDIGLTELFSETSTEETLFNIPAEDALAPTVSSPFTSPQPGPSASGNPQDSGGGPSESPRRPRTPRTRRQRRPPVWFGEWVAH